MSSPESDPIVGLDPRKPIWSRVFTVALLVLECELDRIVDDLGDASLVVGRIVAARARRDALRVSEVGDEEILRRSPVLAYLSPGRYAEIAESRAFPFPAGFER